MGEGHSTDQPQPGSMLLAPPVHLQVQIKQKGQTGKSLAVGQPCASMDTQCKHLTCPGANTAWVRDGTAAISQGQLIPPPKKVLFQVPPVHAVCYSIGIHRITSECKGRRKGTAGMLTVCHGQTSPRSNLVFQRVSWGKMSKMQPRGRVSI